MDCAISFICVLENQEGVRGVYETFQSLFE